MDPLVVKAAQELNQQCQVMRFDTKRLQALLKTGIMDSPKEEVFERMALLAAKLLKAPITIISFLDDRRQFFKAAHGLPEELAIARELPIDASVCQFTLAGRPFIVSDARVDPLLEKHPVTINFGVKGFISYPLVTSEGDALGAFCAIDMEPRQWSEEEMVVLEQLTRAVMTEITLRGVVHDLKEELALKEKLAATLMHDLRSPLGTAQMALRAIADAPEDPRQLIAMAESNLERVDVMIHELLDAARMRSTTSPLLQKRPMDLNHLLREVIADMEVLHGARFSLESEDNFIGDWSRSALRRVLENLINNAVKYGAPKGQIKLHVRRAQEKTGVELSVHNLGAPLRESDKDRIFDLFTRSSQATASDRTGWGLGLSVVQDLVSAHGGEVWFKSDSERGTTFYVRLPL